MKTPRASHCVRSPRTTVAHWVFGPQTVNTIYMYLWAPCGSRDANECCKREFYTYTKHMQRLRRTSRNRPPTTLETTSLYQFSTLILMVTSDFAHSVGAIPFFMMVVIGSATPEREAAYRRCVRYITLEPGLDQCCTRFTRCLCITQRASRRAAWSVACSGIA